MRRAESYFVVRNLAYVALRGTQYLAHACKQNFGRQGRVSGAVQAEEFRDEFKVLGVDELGPPGHHR